MNKEKLENLSEKEVIILLQSISNSTSFYASVIRYGSKFKFLTCDSPDERRYGDWLYNGQYFIKIMQYTPDKNIFKNYNWAHMGTICALELEYGKFLYAYNKLDELSRSFDVSILHTKALRRINLQELI